MTDLRKWAGFGFLMLNVALGFLIGAEIYAWHQTSHPDQTATAVVRLDHETAARPPQPQDQHRQWFNTILARPLFSPDRRPIEVGVRGLPRLTGLMISGSQRVAIFAGASGEHPIVAQAGSRVGAYEVQSISDAGVTIIGPEGTTMVRPMFDVSRPATPGGPPARGPMTRGLTK